MEILFKNYIFIRFLLFLFASFSPRILFAEQLEPDLLFIGKLDRLELIPRGRSECPDPRHNTDRIVISNFCGCGSAEFSVEIASIPNGLSEFVANYRIGEWCEPGINMFSGSSYLVYRVSDGPIRWIESVDAESGQVAFLREDLELLAYELKINLKELQFGPELSNGCFAPEEESECSALPVILAEDLLQLLHISSRSSHSDFASQQSR